MATVLRFRTRRMPPRQRIDPNSMCEVVIFPGVRYERNDKDAPTGPQTKTKRRRAR